jgi:hypothetical protein
MMTARFEIATEAALRESEERKREQAQKKLLERLQARLETGKPPIETRSGSFVSSNTHGPLYRSLMLNTGAAQAPKAIVPTEHGETNCKIDLPRVIDQFCYGENCVTTLKVLGQVLQAKCTEVAVKSAKHKVSKIPSADR